MKGVARTGLSLVMLLSIACGSADPPARAASDPGTSPESSVSAIPSAEPTIEGSFDVGGHELYIRCVGAGSPTIVYLHGYIFDPAGGGSQTQARCRTCWPTAIRSACTTGPTSAGATRSRVR